MLGNVERRWWSEGCSLSLRSTVDDAAEGDVIGEDDDAVAADADFDFF